MSAESIHIGKQGCYIIDKNVKSVTKIIYDSNNNDFLLEYLEYENRAHIGAFYFDVNS